MRMQAEQFGKYARWELERRWLLSGLPAGTTRAVRIRDRYIDGTRLRLRLVEEPTPVYKLAQKIRPDETDPSAVALTNVYLSAAEYAVFAALPAHELSKVRHHLPHRARTIAIDVFEGPLAGLILAEADFESRVEMDAFGALEFAVREVTGDDRYSGGHLARTLLSDER